MNNRLFICAECGKVPNAPMIKEELWLTIATKKTLLCIRCTETKLGRRITIADLETCAANDWTVTVLKHLSPETDVTVYAGYFRIARALEELP